MHDEWIGSATQSDSPVLAVAHDRQSGMSAGVQPNFRLPAPSFILSSDCVLHDWSAGSAAVLLFNPFTTRPAAAPHVQDVRQ